MKTGPRHVRRKRKLARRARIRRQVWEAKCRRAYDRIGPLVIEPSLPPPAPFVVPIHARIGEFRLPNMPWLLLLC